MFLLWKGWGILTPIIIIFLGAVLTIILFELSNLWAPDVTALKLFLMSFSLLFAAGVNWTVGRALNKSAVREVIDAQTGNLLVLKNYHTLFFIRMEYWSIPIAAIGVFFTLGSLMELIGLF